MSVKIFLGAIVTALAALFSSGPDAVSGRIAAVQGNEIRVQLDGGGQLAVRMDADTEIRTQADPAVNAELGCVDATRPEDRSDWVGERVTIMVTEEDGTVRALTITVLPWACEVPYRTQPAGAIPPAGLRPPQAPPTDR